MSRQPSWIYSIGIDYIYFVIKKGGNYDTREKIEFPIIIE